MQMSKRKDKVVWKNCSGNSLTDSKQIAWLIAPIKQENFANFPERIVLNFLICICESSAHNLCVASTDMEVKM